MNRSVPETLHRVGQPDPSSLTSHERGAAVLWQFGTCIELEWVRCPVDGHLLSAADAALTAAAGCAYAVCGRRFAATGIVWDKPLGKQRVSCLAVRGRL